MLHAGADAASLNPLHKSRCHRCGLSRIAAERTLSDKSIFLLNYVRNRRKIHVKSVFWKISSYSGTGVPRRLDVSWRGNVRRAPHILRKAAVRNPAYNPAFLVYAKKHRPLKVLGILKHLRKLCLILYIVWKINQASHREFSQLFPRGIACSDNCCRIRKFFRCNHKKTRHLTLQIHFGNIRCHYFLQPVNISFLRQRRVHRRLHRGLVIFRFGQLLQLLLKLLRLLFIVNYLHNFSDTYNASDNQSDKDNEKDYISNRLVSHPALMSVYFSIHISAVICHTLSFTFLYPAPQAAFFPLSDTFT